MRPSATVGTDSAEVSRIAALKRYGVLDTPPEPAFDRVTTIAAQLFRAPIALVVLVDETRQWFKSRVGLEVPQTAREIAFCNHTIHGREVFVVEDTLFANDFANNPLVTGAPHIRFYAGAPLITSDGHAIGALAVIDVVPRKFSAADMELLQRLATIVMDELESRVELASRAAGESGRVPLLSTEEDRRLALLLEQVPAILWCTDKELRITYSMGAGLASLGFRNHELVGQLLPDVLQADPSKDALAAHGRALRGESSAFQAEWLGRFFAVRVEPLRDVEGSVIGTLGLTVDLTDHKKALDHLQRSNERYRLLLGLTQDVVYDRDLTTGHVEWSDALFEQYGYVRSPAIENADWWKSRIAEADRERVNGLLKAQLEGRDPVLAAEYHFERANGEFADVYDRGYIVRGADGTPVRIIGVIIDMTEKNHMRRQVMQAERLASIGTLAAGVAHEMNNPLSYALANLAHAREELARLLAPSTPLPDSLRQRLEELDAVLVDSEQGAWRAAETVKSLKTFARSDDRTTSAVQLDRVIDTAVRMVGHELRQTARLELAISRVPPVFGSESQFVQVVSNLLVNAAQAIGRGRAAENTIRVTLSLSDQQWVLLEVRDTGPGISKTGQTRIFDPFYTTKPSGVGTGLGLSICHGIVTTAGGRIEVDSEPGHGAVFRVFLPAYVGQPETRSSAVSSSRPIYAQTGKLRVLVVDDEPAVCRAVRRTLGPDHDIVICHSGREALILLDRSADFDVVLCDVMMPDMGGVELCRALTKTAPHLLDRVVLMSGGTTSLESDVASMDRRPRCIAKPFAAVELRELVHRVARKLSIPPHAS